MIARGSLALGVVLLVVAAIWFARVLVGTPLLIIGAAAAPAALWTAAICWIQRGAGRPPALLLASFVWGAAAAAFLSHALNDLGRVWVALLAGADDARAVSSTLVAPIIEEGTKAAGMVLLLLVRRHRDFAGVRDGIVYGGLIGIGFVFTENLLYFMFAILQGGEARLVRSVYLRGLLAGGDHAVFTATIGAGIGWAVATTSRRARPAPCLECPRGGCHHVRALWCGGRRRRVPADAHHHGSIRGRTVPGGPLPRPRCRRSPLSMGADPSTAARSRRFPGWRHAVRGALCDSR